jgi:hypothetical protein
MTGSLMLAVLKSSCSVLAYASLFAAGHVLDINADLSRKPFGLSFAII